MRNAILKCEEYLKINDNSNEVRTRNQNIKKIDAEVVDRVNALNSFSDIMCDPYIWHTLYCQYTCSTISHFVILYKKKYLESARKTKQTAGSIEYEHFVVVQKEKKTKMKAILYMFS